MHQHGAPVWIPAISQMLVGVVAPIKKYASGTTSCLSHLELHGSTPDSVPRISLTS
jgi:hypothetical protein